MDDIYGLLSANDFDVGETVDKHFHGNKDLFITALVSELAFKTGFIRGTIQLAELNKDEG